MTSKFSYSLFAVQLHLGVKNDALKFAIVRQVVNEATFRSTDQHGW